MMQEIAENIAAYLEPAYQEMAAFMKQIRDMQMIHDQAIMQAIKQVPLPYAEVYAVLEEYRKSVLNLVEPFMEMQREIAEEIKPLIIPEIEMIPLRLDSTTEKLLNYIDWLEREN